MRPSTQYLIASIPFLILAQITADRLWSLVLAGVALLCIIIALVFQIREDWRR